MQIPNGSKFPEPDKSKRMVVRGGRARRRVRLGLQRAARPGALEDLTSWPDENASTGAADNASRVDAFADRT